MHAVMKSRMTLFEHLSRGCRSDDEMRQRANDLADKAGIQRGLMQRYLAGEVSVGIKNARRIEQATGGAIKAIDLLYPPQGDAKAS